MRKFLVALLLMAGTAGVLAEKISDIQVSRSWVYLYNDKGRCYKTLSTSSVGTLVGYSADFFVSESPSWVYLYDSDGKRYKTLSKSSVGEVIGVAGRTFTSRSGSWIYTWDMEGRKINTRSAR